MLKMIHGREKERVPAKQELIFIKDAAWPVPFHGGLEYNSPCHGPWNIVHIGMNVPQSHQIYVCGSNCNRGVVLTAAEMQASDRYSTLTLFEEDLINGEMEDLIIEGVTDILLKLPSVPRAVFVFTVCIHRFMGIDLEYIYTALRERFPDIIFVESYMEPISQKGGMTPDQRLRVGMQSFIKTTQKNKHQISIIGSDFIIDADSEIKQILKAEGYTVTESSGCKDFEEYMSMGNSVLYICCYPPALNAVRTLSERLHTPYLYLPSGFSYNEIEQQLSDLTDCLAGITALQEPVADEGLVSDAKGINRRQSITEHLVRNIGTTRQDCEEALNKAREAIGDTAIAIDASAVPRYLGLARLLISHGFRVIRLYGDVFSPEEKEDFEWLKEHAPEMALCSTVHPGMRIFPRGQEEKVLAIGQKAAYFHQTPYFVNIVQGEGLHGYRGIVRMTELMIDAFRQRKDTRDLVERKGLGCKSY